MQNIEPGQKFTTTYGDCKTIEVAALSLRQKVQVTSDLESVQSLQGDAASIGELFRLCERMLRVCVPDMKEELLDEVDEITAMEIVANTLQRSTLSEDERKK